MGLFSRRPKSLSHEVGTPIPATSAPDYWRPTTPPPHWVPGMPPYGPETDERLKRPIVGEPLPRRYPDWQERGYHCEFDAAYYAWKNQTDWRSMENRLNRAKAAIAPDEWDDFLLTLLEVTTHWEFTLTHIVGCTGMSNARVKRARELLLEHKFATQASPRWITGNRLGGKHQIQIQAWVDRERQTGSAPLGRELLERLIGERDPAGIPPVADDDLRERPRH